MDPISNVDRLVQILHQRLAEKARAAGRTSLAPKPETGRRAIERLSSLAGLDDRQFKRALIAQILADQFGGDLVNDVQFQQITQKVSDALDSDPDGRKLFAAVIADLKRAV